MTLQETSRTSAASPQAVLTKAVSRAASQLQLPNATLARILGLSGPTITRMRRGDYVLDPDAKAFELGALFVRVFRSLDAIAGGDDAVAAQWLVSENTALHGKPINRMQKVAGLMHVLQYLDARRALS